jgi:hypothetical protein
MMSIIQQFNLINPSYHNGIDCCLLKSARLCDPSLSGPGPGALVKGWGGDCSALHRTALGSPEQPFLGREGGWD